MFLNTLCCVASWGSISSMIGQIIHENYSNHWPYNSVCQGIITRWQVARVSIEAAVVATVAIVTAIATTVATVATHPPPSNPPPPPNYQHLNRGKPQEKRRWASILWLWSRSIISNWLPRPPSTVNSNWGPGSWGAKESGAEGHLHLIS